MHWRRKWQPTPVYNIPFYKYIYIFICIPHCLYPFICWWTLGLLPIWAIINSVVMNFGVCVSFRIGVLIYFRYIPSSEIVGLYISSAFSFLRTSVPFSIVAASIYIPPAVYLGSLFSTSTLRFVICRLFCKKSLLKLCQSEKKT